MEKPEYSEDKKYTKHCGCGKPHCDKCPKIILVKGHRGKRGPTGPTGPCCPIECLEIAEDGFNENTDIFVIQRLNEETGKCTLLGITLEQLEDALNPDPTICATSWAYDPSNSTCFLDINDPNFKSRRWGWSNGPYDYPLENPIDMQLWRLAGKCDTSKGQLVASVLVENGTVDGTIKITITSESGFCVCDESIAVYAGPLQIPLDDNDKPTVAPGQFPAQLDPQGEFCNGDFKEFDNIPLDGLEVTSFFLLLHANSRQTEV